MIEILAKTPGSSSIEPPPINLCEEVLKAFLKDCGNLGEDKILTLVKKVLDAVKRLLQFEWDPPREQVQEGLCNIALSAEAKLKKQIKEHRDVSTELMHVVIDLEKPWRINIRQLAEIADEEMKTEEPTCYVDWKFANVKWLCNPRFFAPSGCPKMKVGPHGVYDSKEDYMDCVHRLWVAMTFVDGHAAFAPQCRSRGQSGNGCNNALWPIPSSGTPGRHNLRCRTKNCTNCVECVCRIPNHDGLCGKCASRSISRHLEGPGPSASTHIYDCKVSNISQDGVMYLNEFKSRNPPPNDIHWRTTKRLSPPNLVGIVKTRSKGGQLMDKDLIKWGEVVYHGHSGEEERRRKNGDLAINISTIVDFDPDFFEEGTYVVVIDCMTFVPEWIPALKALETQKQARLPFDNGKHLNLLKDHPVISNSVISAGSSEDSVYAADRLNLIENMVDESSLEPIREIKRDSTLRDELVTKLERLVKETTLDKMQLISFIDALRNPVHLTQGPPGTGKSYLGVVLVRSLIMIRDLWVRRSPSLGTPPILVLSYKNHAIDEFLVDLVQAEKSSLSRNKLIRIGGSCKDPRLTNFSERSAFQSDLEVTAKRACLERLNTLRESIAATLSGDIASFLCHRQHISQSDPKTRQKAAVDATDMLMEMIARQSLLESAILELKDEEGSAPGTVVDKLGFLEVSHTREASRNLRRFVEKSDGTAYISQLVEDVKHYNTDHWGEILFMWLCGKVPLPPCSFKKDGVELCGRRSYDPAVCLCDHHRCFQLSDSTRCEAPCASDSPGLCSGHCCDFKNCLYPRLSEKHGYCVGHCCRRCVELDEPSKPATERPPRNFCQDHPACIFPSCLRPCTSDGNYCSEHEISKCLALSKKGRPCKGLPASRYTPYCRDHLHLSKELDCGTESLDSDDGGDVEASTLLPPVNFGERPVCSATTKKGKRCKGKALPGKKFCYDHDLPGITRDTGETAPIEIDVASTHKLDESDEPPQSLALDENNGKGQVAHAGSSDEKDTLLGLGEVGDDNTSVLSAGTAQSLFTANGLDGEKMVVESDELELDNEGDNLQHLREVFEVQDSADTEGDLLLDDASDGEEQDKDFTSLPEDPLASLYVACDPNDWTWKMTEDERWNACQNLMDDLWNQMKTAALKVKLALSVTREDYRQAQIRAKTRMYENKSVIGGTMVGCISRLDAIRATRPFAVVVEEASEVLEPLLFSCLTESTIKLEMIGDHRQLRPSVTSRYDFEIMNNINISMFQRLIEAPCGHSVPSTVLSVQRRMRKNICDLTRDYYADVVEIEDHLCCGLQKIGSRKAASTSIKCLSSSSTAGREVPGISPHVFLWTHIGEQKRSQIGVSRINSQEATMACCLAAYLVECGVPRSSIAILTPYKGQLMLMRNMMFKDSRLAQLRLISRDQGNDDVCRLSTVDRFQGDEEDIVICSLVVDEKSKTAFVKLMNRMIVLLSRARLGLYILGNIAYFENENNMPRHWGKTLELLQQEGCSDSTDDTLDPRDVFTGPRSGQELSLCCPVHRNITMNASSPSSLRLGFCTETCQETIACGHLCLLPCHWPKSKHNATCKVVLDSPCDRHVKKIECNQLYKNSFGAPTHLEFNQILSFYRCSNLMDLNLSCGHVVKWRCWEERKISTGELVLPTCYENSPTPYTCPSCGHSRSVTCHELETFQDDPSSVRCEKMESFEPTCGHKTHMTCWKTQEYATGSKVFHCLEKILVTLPRCGHKHRLPCGVMQNIERWTGASCAEVGKVREGTSYGPQDYPCRVQVSLVRTCGHNMALPCCEAISRATSLLSCREKVKARHPNCGHYCDVACTLAATLQSVDIPEVVEELKEGQIAPPSSFAHLVPPCKNEVRMVRKCGHAETIQCSEARKPLIGCNITVKSTSPLCGHEIDIPCCFQNDLKLDMIWDTADFTSVRSENLIPIGAELARDPSSFDSKLRRVLRRCKKTTTLSLACGHKKIIPCGSLLSSLDSRINVAGACDELVSLRLTCGHKASVTCGESQQYKAGMVHSLNCKKLKRQNCWNHSICGRSVDVKCTFQGTVACNEETSWTCDVGNHRYTIKLCARGIPNSCPGCSLDELKAEIDRPRVSEDERLQTCFALLPKECVTSIPKEGNSDFNSVETGLLRRHLKYQESLTVWKRTKFNIRRVPCFRVLKQKNLLLDHFDPKRFVKPNTMYGMMTKTLCSTNIRKVASSMEEEVSTLLVGYATVVKTKDHGTEDIPGGKKRGAFVKSLWGENYDSLLYTMKGFENLIVWEPFPVQSICRAQLSMDQLLEFAEQLEALPLQNLTPAEMTFSKPPKLCIISDSTTPVNSESDGDDDSSTDGRDEALEYSFRGTCLEGLLVDISWTGGINSDGVVPENVERNLLDKMQFVNKSAKPFLALNQLKSLLSSSPDCPILHLLMAAELTDHSPEKAGHEFDIYISRMKDSDNGERIHPWSIIVAARLDPEHSKELLAAFLTSFPMYDDLLLPNELGILKDVTGSDGEAEMEWPEKLKQQWSQLQNDNPGETRSDAMGKLLNLTGLRKVKEEALRLWKSALQLRRMSPETRKKNHVTANYCFLGNPGKESHDFDSVVED
jgi:hypothetical protein